MSREKDGLAVCFPSGFLIQMVPEQKSAPRMNQVALDPKAGAGAYPYNLPEALHDETRRD
jgi:hypothetical protein